MAYGATDYSMQFRQVSGRHFVVALLLVTCVHALMLLVLWMPQESVPETAVPVRIIARTLVLPAPPPAVTPVNEPPNAAFDPMPPAPPVNDARPASLPPAPAVSPSASARSITKPEPTASPLKKPLAQKKIVPTPAAQKAAQRMPSAPSKTTQKPAITPPSAASPIPPAPSSATVSAPTQAPVIEVPPQFEGVAYLQNPAPAYPILSRRRREQGTVQLQVWVTAAGKAEKVEVLQSSGFPRLDDAAQVTVRQWRFVPAKRGESSVASTVRVPIVFSLK